jgi:hypothetical protein
VTPHSSLLTPHPLLLPHHVPAKRGPFPHPKNPRNSTNSKNPKNPKYAIMTDSMRAAAIGTRHVRAPQDRRWLGRRHGHFYEAGGRVTLTIKKGVIGMATWEKERWLTRERFGGKHSTVNHMHDSRPDPQAPSEVVSLARDSRRPGDLPSCGKSSPASLHWGSRTLD